MTLFMIDRLAFISFALFFVSSLYFTIKGV